MHPLNKNNLIHTSFNILFWAWSFTALCAAIAHIVMPLWTAAGTTWIPSVYWQREIAYFDITLATIFIWVACQSDIKIKRNFAVLLCMLSAALGENHLEGWLLDAKIFHVMFTFGNFLAVLWGGLACWNYLRVPPA